MIAIYKKKSNNRAALWGMLCCLSICIFTVVFSVSFGLFSPEKGGELLIIEPKNIDFGNVGEGRYSATFQLRNASRQPISILHVVGGCSCTKLSLHDTLIRPGKTVKMDCSLDTTGKTGEFHGAIVVGYTLKDVSTISESVTIKPLYSFADIQAVVEYPE